MRIFCVLWIFSLFLFTKALLQQCSEITTSIIHENIENAAVLSVSLTFDVKYDNFSNIITLKNYTSNVTQNTTAPYTLSFCIQSFTTPLNKCYNFTKPIDFSLKNESFLLSVEYEYYSPFFLFLGFVDSGNLISYNGSYFSDAKKCINYKNQDVLAAWDFWDFYNIPKNVQTCCTSLKPITPSVTNAPKCKNFQLTSKVTYDPTNELVSVASADFVLGDNSISAKGTYSDVTYVFGINDLSCQIGVSSNTQYCEYFFDGDENELMITYIYGPGVPNWFLSKIIIRNNQTFMEDGIPFTEPLNCTFSTYTVDYLNYTFENQLCCTNFGYSDSTPIPESPESSFQLCDEINSHVTHFLDGGPIINASVDFRIVNFVNGINNITITNFVSDIPIFFENNSITLCNSQFFNFYENVCYLNSTIISLDNGMFYFNSPWILPISGGVPFTYFAYLSVGIVEDGNFVGSDGSLYSDNNKCTSFQFNRIMGEYDGNGGAALYLYDLNITTCCTSFKSIPKPTLKSPACINFKAISTAYKSTDNSTYGSYSADFKLSDKDIWGLGSFIRHTSLLYGINDFNFEIGNNYTQYGGFPISKQGSEILIYLNWDYNTSFIVGRIILRDGKTFMDIKGMEPFNGKDCESMTQHLAKFQINVISTFCCTSYEVQDVSTTTPLSTTSMTTVTMSSSSKFLLSTNTFEIYILFYCLYAAVFRQ